MKIQVENFAVRRGDTFQRVIYWGTPPFIYKAITGITRAGPVRITAIGHGLVSGWKCAVVSAGGMDEINAHTPPRPSEFHEVTVIDVDHVEINRINSSEYSAYTSGGYLQFYTPVDLTDYTALMQIRDRAEGTVLAELNVSNARILIDETGKTITLNIDAVDTQEFDWSHGVYDLEMISPTNAKTTIFTGKFTVSKDNAI